MRIRANAVGPVGKPLEDMLAKLETLARQHDDDAVRDLLRGVADLSRPPAEPPSPSDAGAVTSARAHQAGDR
jgi:hypothetical protein